MTIEGDNMPWKYEFDVTKEEDFFLKMVSLLGAEKMDKETLGVDRRKCYQVKCPKCSKKCARMALSRDHQRYMLLCPICKKGMNLNSLIRTWYEPNGWLPIKNRKPKGSKKSE